MLDSAMINAENELRNPDSPYYAGRPNAFTTVDNYLKGTTAEYNTNYLGSPKASFLSQPQYDSVQIVSNSKKQTDKSSLLKLIAGGTAGLYLLCALKKVHLVPNLSWIYNIAKFPMKYLVKVLTWPFR